MDILKSLQTLANRTTETSLTQTFWGLLLAGSLFTGYQQKHTTSNDSLSQSANWTTTSARLSATHQLLLSAPLAHSIAAAEQMAQSDKKPAHRRSTSATSMSGARVALASFTSTTDKATTAPSRYQFYQSLKQPLFKAVVSSPFAVGFGDNARLAIWNENPRFAFERKTNQFVIMLDPGHGGSDPGSVGHNGLQEKTLTLDIAKRVERLLSKNKQLSIILTRNNDEGMSRKDRVYKVKRSRADMFVSLHLNHLPQTDVNLVETFYAAPRNILESLEKQRAASSADGMVETAATLNPNLSFTHGSRQLASIMQKRVFNQVIDSNPETNNAGVKADTLYILTRSFTPGALIELSCLSNVKEAERLNDAAYRQRLAVALANGIRDYLATPAAKRQFGPEV